MTDPQVAILMLSLFIVLVLLGFPIAFTLIAMGVAETIGLSSVWLWLGGGALILGRTAHYLTLITIGWGNFRAVGMLLTFAAMGGFSVAILWLALA